MAFKYISMGKIALRYEQSHGTNLIRILRYHCSSVDGEV